MIYFTNLNFNIDKFIDELKLPKAKKERFKQIYEYNTDEFISQFKGEEVIDVVKLMELAIKLKELKRK